jgi:rhodanese-related sulfurtransferase
MDEKRMPEEKPAQSGAEKNGEKPSYDELAAQLEEAKELLLKLRQENEALLQENEALKGGAAEPEIAPGTAPADAAQERQEDLDEGEKLLVYLQMLQQSGIPALMGIARGQTPVTPPVKVNSLSGAGKMAKNCLT